MTSPYGGDQLVWPPPDRPGAGDGDPFGNHYPGQIEEIALPSGRIVAVQWTQQITGVDANGNISYTLVPTEISNYAGGGTGGAGSTWRPGEQAQHQQDLDMMQRHYYITDALAQLTEDRERLNDEYTRAYNTDNLALMRQIESRTAANQAQELALKQQQMALESALGQAEVGANVYQSQTQGRSSQLATMADLTKAAAEAQANPWNPLGYLDFVAGEGGGTPYSNMTAGQTTGYGNQMAQNWQNTFGPVAGQLNRSIEQTYQTPDAITAALQQAQPWYMGSTNYQAASPNQQAIFKGLQPSQQTALAGATPEQMAALARMGQTPTQTALSRYQASTAGEKTALAGATPEQLRILWERGQVR